jgi:DNA-binding response OmpR family regulator
MEFKLLLYFVENKNILLSKSRIIEAVWGSDFDGFDNTLMVHIRHLRKKIEDDSANPRYIQTIKNMGYKFVD